MTASDDGEMAVRPVLPEPGPTSDLKARFLEYLDFYRAAVSAKIEGLAGPDLRTSRLPSGWSPVELVKHLTFMERRWLVWGFLGEPVDEPWGDQRDGRWHVASSERLADLLSALHDGGRRTRAIVESSALDDIAAPGGRFGPDRPPPTLASILFHVLQEYARHAGHLDIARELADGVTGEDAADTSPA